MKITFEDLETGHVLAEFETNGSQDTRRIVDVVECHFKNQCGIVYNDGYANCIRGCGETVLHLMKVRAEVTPLPFDHQPTQPEDR